MKFITRILRRPFYTKIYFSCNKALYMQSQTKSLQRWVLRAQTNKLFQEVIEFKLIFHLATIESVFYCVTFVWQLHPLMMLQQSVTSSPQQPILSPHFGWRCVWHLMRRQLHLISVVNINFAAHKRVSRTESSTHQMKTQRPMAASVSNKSNEQTNEKTPCSGSKWATHVWAPFIVRPAHKWNGKCALFPGQTLHQPPPGG